MTVATVAIKMLLSGEWKGYIGRSKVRDFSSKDDAIRWISSKGAFYWESNDKAVTTIGGSKCRR